MKDCQLTDFSISIIYLSTIAFLYISIHRNAELVIRDTNIDAVEETVSYQKVCINKNIIKFNIFLCNLCSLYLRLLSHLKLK